MKQVGAYEAKTHLPALLKRVSKGEKITITKHGAPVAYLVPVEKSVAISSQQVISELRAFSKGRKLGKLSIKEMIKEGRR